MLGVAALIATASPAAAGEGQHEALRLADWIKRSADHAGRPFAVVDKRQARIRVYDGAGVLIGESPALLGATRGDHTVPGVSDRAQTGTVRPDERTTPAGRFDAIPGRNLSGEHIVWADYASAFAIHRVRPGRSEGPRTARLATAATDDKRTSNGCVVVPVAFYEEVVQRVMGQTRSVVYVLPETRPASDLFGAIEQL
ncbi:MAG: L,D-transpeptidase [Comamonadaceae bacterium]|nr:MAG: L,D-transpeptidase [Comamonadaceae bacterium]